MLPAHTSPPPRPSSSQMDRLILLNTEFPVQEVLAHLGHELQRNCGGHHRRPIPNTKRVHSMNRKEVKPTSSTPSRDSRHSCSSSVEGRSCSRGSRHSVSTVKAMGTL